ncbi:unnamed protein product, partial [Allacma fusca]
VTIPIDYSQIPTPYVLDVFSIDKIIPSKLLKSPIFGVSTSTRLFKETNLRCFAHFVFLLPHSSLNENEVIPTRRDEGLKSVPYRAYKWVVKILSSSVKMSRLVVFIRATSLKTTFFDRLLKNIVPVTKFIPIFTLFPGNQAEISFETYHGQAFIGTSQSTFRCKPEHCLTVMDSTVDNVTNYGKKLSWSIIMEKAEKDFVENSNVHRIGDSPFHHMRPLRLIDTVFKFLLADVDIDYKNKLFCNSQEPVLLFSIRRGDSPKFEADSLIGYHKFPLSYTEAKNFITSDSVSAR